MAIRWGLDDDAVRSLPPFLWWRFAGVMLIKFTIEEIISQLGILFLIRFKGVPKKREHNEFG